MRVVPPDLARRLDGLFFLPAGDAALRLEELVAEVVALVEQNMPQVTTAGAKRHLGARLRPWVPEERH